MLNLLIQYARDHALVSEPGFKPKRARWAVVFDARGQLLGVQELGDAGSKNNPGRQFACCPDLSQPEMKAAGAGCRHFLLDSAEVVALHTKSDLDDRARAKLDVKHHYFVGLLRHAAKHLPELAMIAERLEDPDALTTIRAELVASKAKPTDNVTLAVMDSGVRFPIESPDWHDWWRGFRRGLGSDRGGSATAEAGELMRCLASGELVKPVKTHPKISGLSDVGGLSMGDAFASYKQDAFRSYGLEQSLNAAVSEEMAATYRAALDHLIRQHGKRLAETKVVHWYSGKHVPAEKDPVNHIEDGDEWDDEWEEEPEDIRQTESDARSRGHRLIESFRTAEDENPASFRYYVLVLSGASGRVMVRDWFEGQFGQLRANRDRWFADLAIVHRTGEGLAKRPKFMAVLGSLLRPKEDFKAIPPPVVAKMWRVAVRNEEIPRQVLAQALARVRSDVIEDAPPNHARMGLLKAYHLRRGAPHMECYLNEDHPHPAYHCGRLMAVFADLQYAALGPVGAGVVQRYYAAASTTPALVLGRLARTSQFHLNKLEGGLAYWYEERIAKIWCRIKDHLPPTLTLEEQSLFALGYYQQKAAPKRQDQGGADLGNTKAISS
jgi:CRISPR-associated protein Csd1